MTDLSNLSDAQLKAMYAAPVAAPKDLSALSDDELRSAYKAAPAPMGNAVTDIIPEIKNAANENIDAIKGGFGGHDKKSVFQGFLDTGKAALAVPGLIASPITGAARSLLGHPLADAIHGAGTLINPEVAAKDNPQQMYEDAKGGVDKAMMGARPVGASPAGPVSVMPKPAAAPAVTELKDAARANYKHPTVAAVEIDPASTANLSAKIESDLLSQGFRPKPNQGGPAFDVVKELTPPAGVTSVRVADIDSVRKALGRIADNVDTVGKPTADAVAARTAINHVNDYLPNISKADVIAGDAPAAAKLLDEARGNWAAAKRAEKIDLQLTRADRQAAKSGSGSNIENAMRQKIATMLDNPSRSVGFNAAEKAKMEEIVRGTVPRNVLRKVGKLGVDGGLSLLLHAGAALPTGGASIPIAVGGTAARKIGEMLTARSGRDLSEMVRNRSPLANSRAPVAGVPKLNKSSAAAMIAELLNQQRVGVPRSMMPANAQQQQQ